MVENIFQQLIFRIHSKLNVNELNELKIKTVGECITTHYKETIKLLEAIENNPDKTIADFKQAIQDRLEVHEKIIS